MAEERFERDDHLRRGIDFRAVYDARCSAADGVLVVYARANLIGRIRLGLSVSRKVGNAVVRNRWKRVIREAFRLSKSLLPAGYDLVVIPRYRNRPTLEMVQPSLVNAARQAARRAERQRR